MNPIAKIFAKPDGTFDIAALPMDPRQLVNILLSIAAAVVNRIDIAPAVDPFIGVSSSMLSDAVSSAGSTETPID